jgi:hypothetical protein
MGLAMPIAVWTDPKPPNLAPEPQGWRGGAGLAGGPRAGGCPAARLPMGLIIGREIARAAWASWSGPQFPSAAQARVP